MIIATSNIGAKATFDEKTQEVMAGGKVFKIVGAVKDKLIIHSDCPFNKKSPR